MFFLVVGKQRYGFADAEQAARFVMAYQRLQAQQSAAALRPVIEAAAAMGGDAFSLETETLEEKATGQGGLAFTFSATSPDWRYSRCLEMLIIGGTSGMASSELARQLGFAGGRALGPFSKAFSNALATRGFDLDGVREIIRGPNGELRWRQTDGTLKALNAFKESRLVISEGHDKGG